MTIRAFLEKSLRQIKVLAAGESADGDMIQDALTSFNMLNDMWNAEGLLRPKGAISTVSAGATQLNQETASTIDPSAVYGVSYLPTGGTQSRTLQVLAPEEFQEANNGPEVSGQYPDRIYFYKNTNGDLQCYLFPTPQQSGSIFFYVQERFIATNSNLTLEFPISLVGYQGALMFNLAVFMAPEFGVPIDPNLMKLAEESKAQIMRSNFDAVSMTSDIPALVNDVYFDIYKGY